MIFVLCYRASKVISIVGSYGNVYFRNKFDLLTIFISFSYQHNGICEFPSKQFYDGKLQTADVVKSRNPSPVEFWPALVRRQINLPIVFCHVEGQEESTAITTSESNEESKRNMKEVRKAVRVEIPDPFNETHSFNPLSTHVLVAYLCYNSFYTTTDLEAIPDCSCAGYCDTG